MKTLKHFILWLWVALYTVWTMASCSVEEVTTTSTSKSGLVTVEKRISKKTDPAAWALAGAVVEGYAPRARVVRQEKSAPPSEIRRILKSRPITREEIANRWQPSKP